MRGGSRPNSGRKKKEQTCVIPFRVPVRKKEILKQKIKKIIEDEKSNINLNTGCGATNVKRD